LMYFVPTREPGGPTVLRGDSILMKKWKIEVFFVFREGMKNHKRETRKKKDTYVRGD
jgi:hypothetical protein